MFRISVIAVLVVGLGFPSGALGKDKKKHPPRGMIESMQSISCGVHSRGLNGLGSVFGSVGIEHVNSNEKLCPQYLLRTDDVEYHIRPVDLKHDVLLPIGHEAEFKIKKDRIFLKVPDGDKKTRKYQVISMEPVNSQNTENTAYRPALRPEESRSVQGLPPEKPPDRVADQTTPPRQ